MTSGVDHHELVVVPLEQNEHTNSRRLAGAPICSVGIYLGWGTPVTVIRCTAKLLKLLSGSPGSPTTSSLEPGDDDWYANLLWLDRRKCLLMTQAATLFSLFEPEIVKASINPFGAMAVSLVERELASEELAPNTFGPLQATAFLVGRTCNRSVLGTMTDIRYQIEWAVDQSGGLRNTDIGQLNRWLRRIPFGAISYERPIDRARAQTNTAPARSTRR